MTEPTKHVYNNLTEWHLNSKLHREDGPAVENSYGYKGWYRHGKRHREDGPAVETGNGDRFWYLDGIEYTEEEWFKEIVKRWGKS